MFDSEDKAKKAWEKAEAKVELSRAVDVRRGRKKFRVYVLEEWFPNHRIELSSREGYHYSLHALVLPEFGKMRMIDVMPSDVRWWITRMEAEKVPLHSIRKAKVVLDAIFKTALNELVVGLHPGHGVECPAAATETKLIVTLEQFDAVYPAIEDEMCRLLVETDIESGLRWGELTELRPRDIDLASGKLTVSRAVVQLNPKIHPEGKRFYIKQHPKVQVVKARLGHGSIFTTQGYFHTLPHADETALKALDTIRGTRTTTPTATNGDTIMVSAGERAAMQEAQQKLAEMEKLFA